MEVELDNVRIHQEKTKGQIRRKDTKLLQKCIESLEAALKQYRVRDHFSPKSFLYQRKKNF